MNTEDIMDLSLKLADLNQIPEDSAIYVKGENVSKVLFSIDVGASELLLAKQMNFDCVIAHHPAGGSALVNFHKVFLRQIQQMVSAGIPKSEAESAVQKKLSDLEVDAHTRNYSHTVDAARLLKMPFMNIHTPLDEIGRRIMVEQTNKKMKENSTVQDAVNALNELPEFRDAVTKIKVRLGKPENLAGRIMVSHGAGTNGGYEIARTYFKHGFGTVVYIHVGVGDLEKLKAEGKGNFIVTGHIASDSVGINPFIRELEKKGISVTSIGVVRS
jgi:putative NIF3 family GTP cyclohydrolase 1 type 2